MVIHMLTEITQQVRGLKANIECSTREAKKLDLEKFEERLCSIKKKYALIKHNITEDAQTTKNILQFTEKTSSDVVHKKSIEVVAKPSLAGTFSALRSLDRLFDKIRALQIIYFAERGKCLYEANKLNEAVTMWERALICDPFNKDIQQNLLRIAMQGREPENVEK
jgi:two-component SAPR family response regulator